MSCITDALAEPSYSSESSTGNDAPTILESRQISNRTAAQSRARLQKLKLLRNRRLAQARDAAFSLTSDEDDDRATALLSLKTLAAVKSGPSASHHPSKLTALRRREKRTALRLLPRPSEVVQDIDEGSASDFGLGTASRNAHRRRVTATIIGVQYLNNKGGQDPVPQWTLMRHGLEKYTRLMQPPKEDCFIRNPLTEPALLSRNYRGTLLSVCKIGESRKVRKKSMIQSSDCDSGVCADCEYWDATSGSEFLSSKEDGEPVKPKVIEKEEEQETEHQVLPSKADLLKEVLAESESEDSDSTDSSDEDKGVANGDSNGLDVAHPSKKGTASQPGAADRKGQRASTGPEEDQPGGEDGVDNGQSQPDFLKEIFSMIEENPNALRELPSKSDTPKVDSETIPDVKDVQVAKKKPDDSRPQKPMSKFDQEKQKGMDFCQTRSSAKRSRHGAQGSSQAKGSDRQRRKLNGSQEVIDLEADDERVNYGNATKMMKKMGFTGRLGAKEDGVKEPLRARENAGRSGLGLGLYHKDDKSDSVKKAGCSGGSENRVTADIYLDELSDISRDGAAGHAGEQPRVQGQGTGMGSSEGGSGCVEKELDEEDEYETEGDDSRVDNGRRAILVDVDVLIKNSERRRLAAFRRLIDLRCDVDDELCVDRILVVEKKQLSDADCIKEIVSRMGLERSAEMYESLQADLDDAFEQGEKVEMNFELIRLLKGLCDEVHFGFFYRGSEQRMKAEVGSVYDLLTGSDGTMKLPEVFLRAPWVTVRSGDEWPYNGAWQDLMCRVGVHATQGILLVGEGLVGGGMRCGVAAGVILGARTMTTVTDENGLKIRMRGCGDGREMVELRVEEGGVGLGEGEREVLDELLKEKKKRAKRRRVMALYGADDLWYCGREELGPGDGFGVNVGQSMIRFFKLDLVEWVEDDNVVGLARRDYRKMRDAGFPGVLEVDDVEDM